MTAPTKYATLTPDEVETLTLPGTSGYPRVLVHLLDDATAPVYVTVDGEDPVAAEDGTYPLPAAPCTRRINPEGGTRVRTVKLLSAAAVQVCVEGVPANG